MIFIENGLFSAFDMCLTTDSVWPLYDEHSYTFLLACIDSLGPLDIQLAGGGAERWRKRRPAGGGGVWRPLA